MKFHKMQIQTTKNLLAFSAGIDSSALFFLLVEQNIPFDMAIVNYNQRAESKDEVIYATNLAHKYNKKCFVNEFPKNKKFSEKSARDYRYEFFDEIIKKQNYQALITAHQLNDKCEWFLMQFTKGAGLNELIGMEKVSYKDNYTILKPLLDYSKQSLKQYLLDNKHKFFEDKTNYDEKYKRNYFRHNFSDKLIENFEQGILNSFKYLEIDNNSLFNNISKEQFSELNIYSFSGDLNIAIRIIDKDLKKRGIIISNATREEIISNKEVVVSHKIAIAIDNNKIYIAPYITKSLDKKFKEKCRVNKIPKNIRAYISTLKDFTL